MSGIAYVVMYFKVFFLYLGNCSFSNHFPYFHYIKKKYIRLRPSQCVVANVQTATSA